MPVGKSFVTGKLPSTLLVSQPTSSNGSLFILPEAIRWDPRGAPTNTLAYVTSTFTTALYLQTSTEYTKQNSLTYKHEQHGSYKKLSSKTRLWNPIFQCTSPFRLAIIHLQESRESKTTRVEHNCASLCNIVKEQITKTWFIIETQG